MTLRLQSLCFLLLCAFVLMGCGFNKPAVVQEVKTVIVAPSKSMLKTPEVPKPEYTPEEYSVLSNDQKEDTLTRLSGKLYLALSEAIKTINAVDEWVDKQTTLYKKE